MHERVFAHFRMGLLVEISRRSTVGLAIETDRSFVIRPARWPAVCQWIAPRGTLSEQGQPLVSRWRSRLHFVRWQIQKDVIVRYQLLSGHRIDFRPGWDCHGLPIELRALPAKKTDSNNQDPLLVRQLGTSLLSRVFVCN